jgi:hypothetical protein
LVKRKMYAGTGTGRIGAEKRWVKRGNVKAAETRAVESP